VQHVGPSTWAIVVDWLGANGQTIVLGLAGIFATVFVGVAAIIASDARAQERQRPHVDLEHVRYDVKTSASSCRVVRAGSDLFFSISSTMAVDWRKTSGSTLVQYGDEKPMIENTSVRSGPANGAPANNRFPKGRTDATSPKTAARSAHPESRATHRLRDRRQLRSPWRLVRL
jgi:hypothetical protein